MKPKAIVVRDNRDGTFVDQNCVIEFKGKKYESGGAWITRRKDTGKFEGRVFASLDEDIVQNWHGTIKIPARYGPIWRSNFGDRRRAVYFTYFGREFYGMWCAIDHSGVVNVREVK